MSCLLHITFAKGAFVISHVLGTSFSTKNKQRNELMTVLGYSLSNKDEPSVQHSEVDGCLRDCNQGRQFKTHFNCKHAKVLPLVVSVEWPDVLNKLLVVKRNVS